MDDMLNVAFDALYLPPAIARPLAEAGERDHGRVRVYAISCSSPARDAGSCW